MAKMKAFLCKIYKKVQREKYVEYKNQYFLMSGKLQGSNISDIKDRTMAWKMGGATGICFLARKNDEYVGP